MLLLAAGVSQAQSLEGVLMPGPVIEGHAKLESECKNCHVRFDRAAQDGLCRDCHKEVDADLRARTGYHGRIAQQSCRSCHTDHKGRQAQIVKLDPARFDHNQTDFVLRGGHAASLKCESCHQPKQKFRQAPQSCHACHRKDDVHKGKLGENCAQCHNEVNWKKAVFDHDKTRFALRNKHAPVACASCHRDNLFKDTPLACVACHKKDDTHRTRYGDKCDTCHDDRGWKPSIFNHDLATKYPLRGKHALAKCESCHTGFLYRDKLASDCVACHQKDDKHQGSLGKRCDSCHVESGWKIQKFDHDKTRFALRGKHIDTECKSCHKSLRFKEVESTCVGCHRKDDKHKGKLGEACADCHTEKSWKDSRFDHEKTRFSLQGKHRQTPCESCHLTPDFKRTPSDCLSCHKKDDVHAGTLGGSCADCHNARGWKDNVRFDHGRTRFPLVGRHLQVTCNKCHTSQKYRDVKSECVDCHDKDDTHKRRLGTRCADCHNARDWKLWDFNHDRRTRFALDGAHKRLRCESCHTRPVSGKPTLATTCLACHRSDDVHDGAYGPNCERCHVTSSFKEVKRRTGAVLPAERDAAALNEMHMAALWLHDWFEGPRADRARGYRH